VDRSAIERRKTLRQESATSCINETRTSGPLLDPARKIAKPIPFISRSQHVPRDFEQADRHALAGLVIKDVAPAGLKTRSVALGSSMSAG
jgi:hypothetical protein